MNDKKNSHLNTANKKLKISIPNKEKTKYIKTPINHLNHLNHLNNKITNKIVNGKESENSQEYKNQQYKNQFSIYAVSNFPTRGWLQACYGCGGTTQHQKLLKYKNYSYFVHICKNCKKQIENEVIYINFRIILIETIKNIEPNPHIKKYLSSSSGAETVITPLSHTKF